MHQLKKKQTLHYSQIETINILVLVIQYMDHYIIEQFSNEPFRNERFSNERFSNNDLALNDLAITI